MLNITDHRVEPVEGVYRNPGERGLPSRIIAQEVPPDCDPRGKANTLIMASGVLAGSSVPNNCRLSPGSNQHGWTR
ncbi:MAG: aldehyde ferredoxin oxidoreductase N-terminal domain-containing protein [Desulfopila sp.]